MSDGAFACKWPTYQERDLLTVELVQPSTGAVKGGSLVSFVTSTGQRLVMDASASMGVSATAAPLSRQNIFQVRQHSASVCCFSREANIHACRVLCPPPVADASRHWLCGLHSRRGITHQSLTSAVRWCRSTPATGPREPSTRPQPRGPRAKPPLRQRRKRLHPPPPRRPGPPRKRPTKTGKPFESDPAPSCVEHSHPRSAPLYRPRLEGRMTPSTSPKVIVILSFSNLSGTMRVHMFVRTFLVHYSSCQRCCPAWQPLISMHDEPRAPRLSVHC